MSVTNGQRYCAETRRILKGSGPEHRFSTPDILYSTCVAAAEELSARSAAISLLTLDRDGATLAGSDERACYLNDAQFDLGEGPSFDAVDSRCPVLVSDLAGSDAQRWPTFAHAALQAGARGAAVFPLQAGAACIATLTVYREETGVMPCQAVAAGLAFADLAMQVLIVGQVRAGDGQVEPELGNLLEARMGVYRAQGFVMAELGITPSDAMALLRATAYSHGQPVTRVAADVLERRLRLRV